MAKKKKQATKMKGFLPEETLKAMKSTAQVRAERRKADKDTAKKKTN